MAILFAVMATIVILRDIALFSAEFVSEYFVNKEINNEKISIIMFGIAAILFAIGLKRSEQIYSEG
jgi:hypothetical protein